MTQKEKQAVALYYQRNTQRATCNKYGISAQQAKQIVQEVYGKLKSHKDTIEQKYSSVEIRRFYALYLAGYGIRADYEDLLRHWQLAAFDERVHIDQIVFELSEVWERFSNCHTMQPHSRIAA
ncbi:hypothetical protein FVR03_01210 [Pontibacter qinzhouensis]|uniref:Uncharacterized protein n=1 Tax=Pontibacter qinzhouensis TaxID=2603253 RepID=A0A5C8KEY0_9BACT|nr:hypothetical protein [Pontibacter qinzhouensis]TXK52362.1 hypothetical protein FVR03_01210 [Pontibacter qinzhouensis]